MTRLSLENKTILITGSTDGIGKEAALELAKMGAQIIGHGRDPKKCRRVCEEIRTESENSNIQFYSYDFSALGNVKDFAEKIMTEYSRIDVLINNAGVYMGTHQLSADDYEMTFAVNHLAHFLLTKKLIEHLKKNLPARIINVSSIAHFRGKIDFDDLFHDKKYDGYQAYAASKLANVLFTYSLGRRLAETGVTVNAVHPGVINTKLLVEGFGNGGDSVENGAKPLVFLACAPEIERVSLKYFDYEREAPSSHASYDMDLQERFWHECEKLVSDKKIAYRS